MVRPMSCPVDTGGHTPTEAPNMRNVVDRLSDNVLTDIFRYLPARSLCCCKCVYHSKRRVISDSYQRKKLTQTVVSFFYGS